MSAPLDMSVSEQIRCGTGPMYQHMRGRIVEKGRAIESVRGLLIVHLTYGAEECPVGFYELTFTDLTSVRQWWHFQENKPLLPERARSLVNMERLLPHECQLFEEQHEGRSGQKPEENSGVSMSKYEDDVYAHKRLVEQSLSDICFDLVKRRANHDLSKLGPEERDIYERVTPEFAGVTYGTPEYEAVKAKLGPALDHHYQVNDHHPEHFENGIAQMDLMQITEMACDWYAAMRRDPNAHLIESLEKLRDKYHIEPQLYSVILNTVLWLRNGGVR